MRINIGSVAIFGLLLSVSYGTSVAGELDYRYQRGQTIVEESCDDCHAIGPSGVSPLEDAPVFRQLGQRYPIDFLAEAFAEGIITGHPDMPEFELAPEDVDALLAYLEAIQEPKSKRTN